MLPNEKPSLKRDQYEDCVTPVFTPDRCARLRQARHILRLRQEDVARGLGVSQRSVSALETGNSGAGQRAMITLRKFQEIYGRDLMNYVLTGAYAAKYLPLYHGAMLELAKAKEKRRT